MMRRRFRPISGRKGTREQFIWTRTGFSAVAINSASTFGAVASPLQPSTILGGSGLDQRLTLDRLKLYINWTISTTFANTQAFLITLGVLLVGNNETVADVKMTANTAKQQDWLWLGEYSLGSNVTAGQDNRSLGYPIAPDIKSKRKVDADQNVSLVASVHRVDGAAWTGAGELDIGVFSSAGFQRTRR